MFKAESYAGHKLCWPGDLVINSLWAWNRGLGVAKDQGIVSTAYGVYRPRPASGLSSGYLHELARSDPFQWELHVRSKGVWISRLQLTDTAFLDAPIPLPPIEDQCAIVRFLDHADRRIRRYIRIKQKLIALLEEQKQAIIDRALTRGLAPNIRLKPSGIPWLGDVPEHWSVTQVKHVTTPIEQGWSPQCHAQPAGDNEWAVMKVGCVNRDNFNSAQNKRLPPELQPRLPLEIRDGDIMVSRANTRELLGLAAFAVNPRPKLLLCDKLFRFRALGDKVDARYLVYAIRQRTSRAQIESSTNGASDSMQNIGQGVIANLALSLPPLAEQRLIAASLSEQTVSLVDAVKRAESMIERVREYRTRLFADVVTGQLDVRAAAAALPDEPDASDPLDDVTDIDDPADEDDATDNSEPATQ